MASECPFCKSQNTGGSPKRHKQYTERGRLDIDYMRCDDCRAAWDLWRYVREGVCEVYDLRDGAGNRPEWGSLPLRICKRCEGSNVRWMWHDGKGPKLDTELLRYKCTDCGEIFQELVNAADGKRVSWHTVERGK